MEKLISVAFAVVFAIGIFAQPPAKISYQGVIRNLNNQIVANQVVGIKICILKEQSNGPEVYSEIQTPTTNSNGLLSIEIGAGAGFMAIDWSMGKYFIKTEVDPLGGANFTITGVSQILSVPYALYAKTSGDNFSGNYIDLTNKPNLSDTSKYIKKENDPLFWESIAKGIKSGDTANWNAKVSLYELQKMLRNVTTLNYLNN